MKHESPRTSQKATAPYNFIELPNRPMTHEADSNGRTKHDRYVLKPDFVHSGYFECELTTSSPLYIRGMMEVKDFLEFGSKAMSDLNPNEQRKRAQFSRNARGELEIPASSLRGMVRNMYEIITLGKMSRVTNRRLAYRSFEKDRMSLRPHYEGRVLKRSGSDYEPIVRAGYMERDGDEWYVRPAKTIDGVGFCRVKHINLDRKYLQIDDKKSKNNTAQNRKIFFRPVPPKYHEVRPGVNIWMSWTAVTSTTRTSNDLLEGAIAPSNAINGKASEAIIYPPDTERDRLPLKFLRKDVRDEKQTIEVDVAADYELQLTRGQKEKLGERGVLQDGHPVFYIVGRDHMNQPVVDAIGHTMMMRLLYKYSPFEMLPILFRSDDTIDSAESVFGYVRTKKRPGAESAETYASRVHFSPGVILPDISAAEEPEPIIPYILSSPKPTTFQHYLSQNEPDQTSRHVHFDTPNAMLRGHKLYWHKGKLSSDQMRDPSATKITSQHTLVKMVRPGVKFKFRVYFENLSNFELGALHYVLTLPSSGTKYRYKLGMAKPLGAGAVSIEAKLHLYDRDVRYTNLFAKSDQSATQAVWEKGEWSENVCSERIKKAHERFTGVVRKELDPSNKTLVFEDLPRMRQLLKMLDFDNSSKQNRGYMELSEFKIRPVLPRPEHV